MAESPHQLMLGERWTRARSPPSFLFSLRPLTSAHPLLLQPLSPTGLQALSPTLAPGPLPGLFPLPGLLPLQTLTQTANSLCLSEAVFSVGPSPSHPYIIAFSRALRLTASLPCASVLSAGCIIHCFYFLLFMPVSPSRMQSSNTHVPSFQDSAWHIAGVSYISGD